jgi:hypothetical protein
MYPVGLPPTKAGKQCDGVAVYSPLPNWFDMLIILFISKSKINLINIDMKIAKFVYRIVFKKTEGYYMYFLQEENDTLYFISTHPISFFGYNIQELESKLKNYADALKLPVVNYEDIKEYIAKNIPPIVYPPLKEYPF